mmetsp:Transcript_16149/g.23691  ORF Transcript_16149/g.23691 Transcript_16149/m.23691 type:complete len:106 (-) Transcript_16149:680-997(-)
MSSREQIIRTQIFEMRCNYTPSKSTEEGMFNHILYFIAQDSCASLDLRVERLFEIRERLISFCSAVLWATSFLYAAASSLFRRTLLSLAAFLARFLWRVSGVTKR